MKYWDNNKIIIHTYENYHRVVLSSELCQIEVDDPENCLERDNRLYVRFYQDR